MRQRQDLATDVKVERGRRGWSQQNLANEAQVNPGTIRQIEQGRMSHVATVTQVCDTLGLDPKVYLRPEDES